MATDPMTLYGRDITTKTFFSSLVACGLAHICCIKRRGKKDKKSKGIPVSCVHGVERPWTITYNTKGRILFNKSEATSSLFRGEMITKQKSSQNQDTASLILFLTSSQITPLGDYWRANAR